MVIRIITSLDYCSPCPVFAGHVIIALVCFTMPKVKMSAYFTMVAATRISVAGFKIITISNNFVATVTKAGPDSATSFDAAGNATHKQAAETLPRYVNEFSGHEVQNV